LIEGPIDYDEPTILIDDSISSGLSMTEGCNIWKRPASVSKAQCVGAIWLVFRLRDFARTRLPREALYDVYEDLMATWMTSHLRLQPFKMVS